MESQSSTSSEESPHGTKSAKAPALTEIRFDAEWNRPDWVAVGASVVAGLLLGAGTYAIQWSEPPVDYGNFLLLGGVVAAGFFAFRLTSGKTVARVGDAGVALEQGGDLARLLWSEIQSVRYKDGHLVLVGVHTTLRLSSQCHTRAIRSVLAEAAKRLPKILDVPGKLLNELPAVTGGSPKPGPVESLQIAGKHCLVTQQLLTFERDARLCPNCTSIYHRDHVPALCVTCERELGDAAIKVDG
jgi:hypothetical protein